MGHMGFGDEGSEKLLEFGPESFGNTFAERLPSDHEDPVWHRNSYTSAIKADGLFREVGGALPGLFGHGEAGVTKNPWTVAQHVRRSFSSTNVRFSTTVAAAKNTETRARSVESTELRNWSVSPERESSFTVF